MNKVAVLYFMAALCVIGCKSITSVELIEPQELPLPTAKPKGGLETIAWNSKKPPFADTTQPLEQTWKAVPKPDHAEKQRRPSAAGKPATVKKDSGEKSTSTIQPANIPLSGIPRDVWYVLVTILGAVFTSILGPIVVEIIRERMAFARQQVDKQQNRDCESLPQTHESTGSSR